MRMRANSCTVGVMKLERSRNLFSKRDATSHGPDIATTEEEIVIDQELEGTLAQMQNVTELLGKEEAAEKRDSLE
jgi:hypothetical protein